MEDFKSKYTGEQVESFLDKIEDNSIILDNTVNYADHGEPLPISSDAVRKLWDRKGYIYDVIMLSGGDYEVSGNTKFYNVPKAPIVVWKSESFELKVGETKVISNGPPIRATLNYIEDTGKYILNIEDPNGALATNRLYYVNSVEPIADILIPNNIVRKSDINLPFYIDEVNLQTLILEYNENKGNPSPISSVLYENIVKAVSEKNLIFIKRDTVKEGGYILLNIRKDDFLYYSILTEDGNIIYGEISNEYIHIYNIIPIENIQNMMEDFNVDIGALYQTKQDAITDLEEIRQGAAKGATALQSYTERYRGTVTGVKINGSTKSPSSGVVDLGTVITAHQILKTINGQSIVGSGNIEISGGGGGTSGGSKEFVEIEPKFSPVGYEGAFSIEEPLQPNKVYVFTEALQTLYINNVEISSDIADEYTIMFTAAASDVTLAYNLEMGSKVYWANGAIPTISEGDMCELSIVRIGSNFKSVLTTFKPVN
jgi:hypothetical protein